MRRSILVMLSLTAAAAGPLHAGTFERSPLAPELGVDALTRTVTREQVGKDLFSDPYSTVTLGTVDVYDVFPYVESRTFQVVSDPRWNRLVFGERGKSLRAYDGAGQTFGPLSEPRGMAVDEANRVYVADAGNDRVLVLKATTEFDDMRLTPLYEIRGLSHPYDVSVSDAGTPFSAGDDVLYVADTGRNRIAAFALEDAGARLISAVGELGSGRGRFAGPMAIAAGRSGGANTNDVFVADAHTRRLVHLRLEGGAFQWVSDVQQDADVVTSLDTDQWGNLYAAAPHQGAVRKFNADLAPVAELRDGMSAPRSFHVPFLTVRDHRAGSVTRVGRPNGLSVDRWSDASGVRLWNLGVDVTGLAMTEDGAPTAHFTLTDQASVTIEIADAATGQTLARRASGPLGAGVHDVALDAADLAAAGAGDRLLRVSAVSSYADGGSASAQTRIQLTGGGAAVAAGRPALIGNTPNPATVSTRIAFVLPGGSTNDASLRVYDARGRLIRSFENRFAPGLNEVTWDGRDDHGARVPAGIYFYRLSTGAQAFTKRMAFVR